MRRISLRRLLCIIALLLAFAYLPDCSLWGQEPAAPGLHDLVVFDPGVHERGLPSPQFDRAGNGLTVDIPPAVHVHRYYYSGDKEIQGPIINGGPTIVVASHPKTGKRMYIDVTLPAGAPRIAYNKSCITYVYPHKRVAVTFNHFPLNPDKVTVKYHSGQGVGRTARDWSHHVKEHVNEGIHKSAFLQSVKATGGEAGKLAVGVGEAAGKLTSQTLDALKSGASIIPGVSYFKSLAEERGNRQYQTQIDVATDRIKRETPEFVPTIR